MTREELVALTTKAARSEDSRLLGCGLDDLERFAELVANECAKACENSCSGHGSRKGGGNSGDAARRNCAVLIRTLFSSNNQANSVAEGDPVNGANES